MRAKQERIAEQQAEKWWREHSHTISGTGNSCFRAVSAAVGPAPMTMLTKRDLVSYIITADEEALIQFEQYRNDAGLTDTDILDDADIMQILNEVQFFLENQYLNDGELSADDRKHWAGVIIDRLREMQPKYKGLH